MSALSQSSKASFLAVRFQHGDPASPTFERFTDYPTSVVGPDGSLFTSRVQMKVENISLSAALEESPFKLLIELGASGSFTDQVSSGEPHSPIKLDVWEIINPSPSALPVEVLHLFSGDVQIVTRNADGNTNLIEVESVHLKSQLEIPMGLVCMSDCVWTFTGRGCNLSPAGLAETGTLTAKDSSDGMIVTITGLSAHTGRYWHRGYVEVDGLRIGIRDWEAGDATTFCLVVEPPARWVGVSVSVFPGCDKTLDTCRVRWNNEEHFCGLGFAMPAYHPVVEDGTA